jgi:hypothetical protein
MPAQTYGLEGYASRLVLGRRFDLPFQIQTSNLIRNAFPRINCTYCRYTAAAQASELPQVVLDGLGANSRERWPN